MRPVLGAPPSRRWVASPIPLRSREPGTAEPHPSFASQGCTEAVTPAKSPPWDKTLRFWLWLLGSRPRPGPGPAPPRPQPRPGPATSCRPFPKPALGPANKRPVCPAPPRPPASVLPPRLRPRPPKACPFRPRPRPPMVGPAPAPTCRTSGGLAGFLWRPDPRSCLQWGARTRPRGAERSAVSRAAGAGSGQTTSKILGCTRGRVLGNRSGSA